MVFPKNNCMVYLDDFVVQISLNLVTMPLIITMSLIMKVHRIHVFRTNEH